MPVINIEHHRNRSITAVWEITETEEELLRDASIPNNEAEELLLTTNPQRRLERIAVRVLLNKVLGEKVYLRHHDNGRPFLPNNTANLSITHTQRFAAIIYNEDEPVGIDMEALHRDFSAVEHKALSDEERNYLSGKHRKEQLCILWCAKEALYKFISENGIDFARQLYVEKFSPKKQGKLKATYTDNDGWETDFELRYETVKDHMMVWVEKRIDNR